MQMKKLYLLTIALLILLIAYPAFSTYIPNICRMLKTGQTTSYHADDDGDLELGIAPSYTTYTTGQYSGTTNLTINGKTIALSNECVQDNRTGLMWARYVPQTVIGPAANGMLFWEQYTVASTACTCNATNHTITADAGTPFDIGALCAGRIFDVTGSALGNNGTFTVTDITTSKITVSEAVTDEASVNLSFATVDDLIWDLVDQANANSLGGYTDWRIPNRRELESIVDLSGCSPSINTTVFPSTPTTHHWTASTNPCSSAGAWFVHFSNGYVNSNYKSSYKYYVRLARGMN
jgi:hypothetical protein